MTMLPKDRNDLVIPALRLKDGGAHALAISASSANNTTAFDPNTRVISIYATVPVYLKFAVSDTIAATTSDHFFPAGIYYDVAIGGGDSLQYTYLAAIRAADDGALYISEKV